MYQTINSIFRIYGAGMIILFFIMLFARPDAPFRATIIEIVIWPYGLYRLIAG